MAQIVRVASVLFEETVAEGAPDAKQVVLKQTADALTSLAGLGLDLVVFSEGVGAIGQVLDDAEDPHEPGPFLALYRDFAVAERCHVAGSAKTRVGGKVHNSVVFFGPSGQVLGVYHKVYLTIGELEQGLAPGAGPVVVDTPVGRLAGVICFDLNFETLRQQYRVLKPDILVYSSMYHGGLQQQTWAYDCRAYFVCACQFLGGGILDPFGRPLALTSCYTKVAVADINLDRAMVHLDYNRDRFPEIRRKYGDEVAIEVPPNIGSTLILSLTDKRSAMDVVREFELELLDDYLPRAGRRNAEKR